VSIAAIGLRNECLCETVYRIERVGGTVAGPHQPSYLPPECPRLPNLMMS
jgi:hypothetical protein